MAAAVALWWEDCKTTRTVSQAPRKEYQPRKSSNAPSTSSESQAETAPSLASPETEVFALQDWDEWFDPPSPAIQVDPDVDSDSDIDANSN